MKKSRRIVTQLPITITLQQMEIAFKERMNWFAKPFGDFRIIQVSLNRLQAQCGSVVKGGEESKGRGTDYDGEK